MYNKFAQDIGIKHQGSWTSAILKGGSGPPRSTTGSLAIFHSISSGSEGNMLKQA